jgi:cell division protein FtsW (lipid II flippase)
VGLPFFSYGGSMLLTFMTSTAILLNLSRKRYIF